MKIPRGFVPDRALGDLTPGGTEFSRLSFFIHARIIRSNGRKRDYADDDGRKLVSPHYHSRPKCSLLPCSGAFDVSGILATSFSFVLCHISLVASFFSFLFALFSRFRLLQYSSMVSRHFPSPSYIKPVRRSRGFSRFRDLFLILNDSAN